MVSELIEHESWNFLFLRKYGLYDFMCTCCTPDSDLKAMQKKFLNHMGISVTLSVTLCSYLMQTVPHQRKMHILVCYFHPTLKLLFKILPLLCVVHYYTVLFWQGIGFYKTSNRIVSMTYLYFQKYCVWTSFHWIQFRSSLGSPGLSNLQEMTSPL
jgi:hypothetical protein